MKNILKKLGVFTLICGVLSPFASFPKVNAETCDHYLQQYLFLDVTNGTEWEHYTKSKGYRTYTTFAYAFPKISSTQTLTIEKVGNVDLVDKDYEGLESFYSAYTKLLDDTVEDRKLENQANKIGHVNEYQYYNSNIISVTHLLHGYWGYDGEKYIKADYGSLANTLNTTYKKDTIQGVIITKSDDSKKFDLNDIELSVDFSGASLSNNKFYDVYNSFSGDDEMVSYFQQIVNDVNNGLSSNSKSVSEGYVWKSDNSDSDSLNLNIGIKRNIGSKTDLNNLNFGYTGNNNKDVVWSIQSGDVVNSYTALLNYGDNCVDNNKDDECDGVLANTVDSTQPEGDYCTGAKECYLVEGNFDIDTAQQYYWPAIMNVEYSVCDNVTDGSGNSETPVTGEWKLKYNKNTTDSVANMPSPDYTKAATGSEIEVTSKVPTRKGYTFKEWCTNENGSGDCYKSGKKVGNSENKAEVTLFAQWIKEGTEENKKTGVVSYVLGFAAVGLVASGIYLISKKKNLFKQI